LIEDGCCLTGRVGDEGFHVAVYRQIESIAMAPGMNSW